MSSRTDEITLQTPEVSLEGSLTVPEQSRGLVLFAHGSGSSRFSPRNQFVAGALNQAGLATPVIDMNQEAAQQMRAENRIEIVP